MTARKTGGSIDQNGRIAGEEFAITMRAKLVVAEICSETYALADDRMRQARKIADELKRLADSCRELMAKYVDLPDSMPFTKLERLKSMRGIGCTYEILHEYMDLFLKEHRALVSDDIVSTIENYGVWVQERANELSVSCRGLDDQYLKSLNESRDELRELSRDWSVVDADGLVG